MNNFGEERDTGVILKLCAVNKTLSGGSENTERPVWSRVNAALKDAFSYGGGTDLRRGDIEGYLAEELNMTSLPGKFRITLMRKSSVPRVGGYDMYEWWEPGDAPFRGVIRFGDDDWDARTVCTDLAVAQALFLEFFETGELREGMSSMRSV